jgi:TolA-binding protein
MKNIDEQDTQANPADAEPEFDFSRRLVSRMVPYADVQHAQTRTWKRLNQSIKREAGAPSGRNVRRQLSGIAAVCTLTFVAGVWVGKHERTTPFGERSISAEPVAFEHRSPTHSTEDLGIVNGDVGNGAGGVGAPAASLSETSGSHDGDKLARVNARGRGTHGTAAIVRPHTGLDTLPNLSGEPVPSVASGAVVSGPGTSKSDGSRPSWHNLANKGEYEAALVEIAQAGGYERVLASANPEQLMLLSDVARATGQQQRALAALRRIVNEHSNDPVAPLAALNMGNLLDKMGDGSGATAAFARYRALSPKGEFAEDALVRQLRSAVRAGQQALARKLVRQYEADFPDGRSAGEVAQLAEQLPEIAIQADAGVPQ